MNWKSKTRLVGIITVLGISASLSMADTARAEIFKDYPVVIVCRVLDMSFAVYIDRVKDDGSAIYKTLDQNGLATVTPDHVLHRAGAKDCDGKTFEQLRQDGQTRETH